MGRARRRRLDLVRAVRGAAAVRVTAKRNDRACPHPSSPRSTRGLRRCYGSGATTPIISRETIGGRDGFGSRALARYRSCWLAQQCGEAIHRLRNHCCERCVVWDCFIAGGNPGARRA